MSTECRAGPSIGQLKYKGQQTDGGGFISLLLLAFPSPPGRQRGTWNVEGRTDLNLNMGQWEEQIQVHQQVWGKALGMWAQKSRSLGPALPELKIWLASAAITSFPPTLSPFYFFLCPFSSSFSTCLLFAFHFTLDNLGSVLSACSWQAVSVAWENIMGEAENVLYKTSVILDINFGSFFSEHCITSLWI